MRGAGLSFALLGTVALFWVICRLLAARPTIGAGKSIIFFGVGSVAATVCAVVIERLSLLVMPAGTASFTVGPIVEELAKAALLLVIAFWTLDARRLTLADLALIGVTVGLGFQFVESNLHVMATGSFPNFVTPIVPGLVQGVDHAGGTHVYDVGHAISTGLVGLAIGVGVRFVKDIRKAEMLAGFVLLWVVFDHAMFNWKLGHRVAHVLPNGSVAVTFKHAFAPFEWLYAVTLHSLLELVVFALCLGLAAWLERGRDWALFSSQPAFLLRGERDPPTLIGEWAGAMRGLRTGWQTMQERLSYFRHRRALVAAHAHDAVALSVDPFMGSFLSVLREEVQSERQRLEVYDERERLEGSSVARRARIVMASLRAAMTRIAKRYPIALAVAAALLVLLLVLRAAGVINHLYGRPVALVLALVAVCFAGWRIRRFYRQRGPDPSKADGEALSGYRARAVLTHASLATAAFAVLAWFLPKGTLSPTSSAAFLLGALDQWIAATGATGAGLLALGGLVGPKNGACPPCADLLRDVEDGAARLAAARANAAKTKEQMSAAAQALQKARDARRQAESGLKALANESYVEATNGPLAGVRLTSSALRKQRAAEAEIRARLGRGELSAQDAESELSKWADPDYVQSLGEQSAQDAETKRQELQHQLDDARDAETKALAQQQAAADAAGKTADALAAEQAAQQGREAALAECEGAVLPQPPDLSDVEHELDQLKRDFEDRQRDLGDVVDGALSGIGDFANRFEDLWTKAMKNLDDWIDVRRSLAPDLAKIHAARQDMADAMRLAESVDYWLGVAEDVAMIVLPELAELKALEAGEEAAAVERTIVKLERSGGEAALQKVASRAEAEAAADAAASERLAAEEVEKASRALEEGKALKAAQEAERLGRRAQKAAEEIEAAADAASARTGRLSLINPNEKAAQLIQDFPPKPGYFDVVVHGNRSGVGIARDVSAGVPSNFSDLSPKQLADLMRGAGYQGGPVRLVACDTGGIFAGGLPGQRAYLDVEGSFAKQLSEELGAPVLAPNDIAYIGANPRVGRAGFSGGFWREFTPGNISGP